MTTALVECVPNFSEGRRLDVVEKIVQAVQGVRGVVLLDYSSDADHNRSVLTFVGPPQEVADAAYAAIAKAAELIDLDQQRGEHPRIGATDVVPFIPISGITTAECVELAKGLGERVAKDLNIPVYLYEKAASAPERENLANLRKGEYEGLKEEIKTNPARQPDYGSSELGTAGATVIGVRDFLVAYNVYLDTDNVEVAKEIGRSIRHLSGGLRYVKALGMEVEGKAQVSMNLTNYRKTPIFRVVEMIRREAARYGANITHSELIGMIPQQALFDAAVWYLQLDGFSEQQVLEYKIAQEQAVKTSFLDELADGAPTPGGGSAAAYAGAMAAGLVSMVAKLTLGKKKYAMHQDEMEDVITRAEKIRGELNAAVAQDADAYNDVMAAYRMPRSSDEQKSARDKAIETATLHAAEVPLSVMEKAITILLLAKKVVEKGNQNAITDGGTAAALAMSAVSGAGMNVRVNLSDLKDTHQVEALVERLRKLEEMAEEIKLEIKAILTHRGNLAKVVL